MKAELGIRPSERSLGNYTETTQSGGFRQDRRRPPRFRRASSCDELFAQAATLGIESLAIVDRNSLAGIVRAHEAAKATGVRLIVGCRLDLTDGMSVLVYLTDRPAYALLCRLLSLGKKRAGKAQCRLDWSDVVAYGEGLIAILVPDQADDLCAMNLRRLAEAFGDRAFMALTLRRRPNDAMLKPFDDLAHSRLRDPNLFSRRRDQPAIYHSAESAQLSQIHVAHVPAAAAQV